MRAFSALYQRLDRTTATREKQAALSDYFRQAAPADAAWALWILSGGKVGGARARIAGSAELRAWVSEETGLAPWLVDASYAQVGDLAETLALLMPEPLEDAGDEASLATWIEARLQPVANAAVEARRAMVVGAWRALPFAQRLVFNKLLTGALRVGVSAGLVHRAIAEVSGLDVSVVAQRTMGRWQPSGAFWQALCSTHAQPGDRTAAYPFFLASPLEADPETLGDIDAWCVEWKWDGIRAQLIRRAGETAVWSRGEERMDGRFPEIETALHALPADAVIDGELLAWREGEANPLPFTALQKRIQRLKPTARTLADTPVRVLAYDLLELDGVDLRERPLRERRERLERLLAAHADPRIVASPLLAPPSWQAAHGMRTQARERGVEGFMLKRLDSPYRHGRKRGDWWKWKVDPLTIDAVLVYAQSGHGRRSTLFTDYTFALWREGQLVPVAKAYSGLTDAEILQVDRWIRAHTLERFGPVRSVAAEQVFELGFEAVNRSSRHKSGIAVRFPRILRWRQDKRAEDADRLETLQALAQ